GTTRHWGQGTFNPLCGLPTCRGHQRSVLRHERIRISTGFCTRDTINAAKIGEMPASPLPGQQHRQATKTATGPQLYTYTACLTSAQCSMTNPARHGGHAWLLREAAGQRATPGWGYGSCRSTDLNPHRRRLSFVQRGIRSAGGQRVLGCTRDTVCDTNQGRLVSCDVTAADLWYTKIAGRHH